MFHSHPVQMNECVIAHLHDQISEIVSNVNESLELIDKPRFSVYADFCTSYGEKIWIEDEKNEMKQKKETNNMSLFEKALVKTRFKRSPPLLETIQPQLVSRYIAKIIERHHKNESKLPAFPPLTLLMQLVKLSLTKEWWNLFSNVFAGIVITSKHGDLEECNNEETVICASLLDRSGNEDFDPIDDQTKIWIRFCFSEYPPLSSFEKDQKNCFRPSPCATLNDSTQSLPPPNNNHFNSHMSWLRTKRPLISWPLPFRATLQYLGSAMEVLENCFSRLWRWSFESAQALGDLFSSLSFSSWCDQ